MAFRSVLRSPRSFIVIIPYNFVHTCYLRVSDIGKSFWRSRFAANLTSTLTLSDLPFGPLLRGYTCLRSRWSLWTLGSIVVLRFMNRFEALSCAIVANLGYLCGTHGLCSVFCGHLYDHCVSECVSVCECVSECE